MDGEDQEDNFNKMANLELDHQRRDIKKVLQKKLEDVMKKQAAEEAKKKKKLEWTLYLIILKVLEAILAFTKAPQI